ncbi:MAG: S24/S26 family peptidase [Clostridia bacterium]|nr:S24/S26 family peptidase [Clostridia bacterium]
MNKNNEIIDYETIIQRDGVLAQLTKGFSMMPLIRQNRDTIIVKKLEGLPKENDVLLYKNNMGKYVLHRVIKVLENGYIIRGDNNFFNEYDIENKNIIGVLEGFYRDDKFIDCNKNKLYKIYVQLNRRTYYLRKTYSYFRSILSKTKHAIVK